MRRRIFTTAQYYADGHTQAELRWAVKTKALTRIERGVFAEGDDAPDDFEKALARMMASNAPAWGLVAGVLHGFDSVAVPPQTTPKRRQTVLVDDTLVVIDGVMCTSPLQAIVDLAEFLDDLKWEQSLESGLRRKRDDVTGRRRPPQFLIADLVALLPLMSKTRRHGATRIRRVLDLRGFDTPATDSLLETLMVQLIRTLPGIPTPVRQYSVHSAHGGFVARVDLCWPDLGLFIELDGMHHAGQPVYDAARETAVVAATGWLPGRFTWREVRYNPVPTGRRLAELMTQARLRPLAAV